MPKKAKTKKPWWLVPVGILVVAVAVAGLILKQGARSSTVSDTPKARMVDCLGTDQESSFDCWSERMQAMVEQNANTDAVFTDIEAAYATSPYVKSNCHQIAHVIGRTAGKKLGDVAKAYQDGDDFCWSGYYHGVMEAVVATTDKSQILSNLNEICAGVRAEKLYGFNHFNCVHGLGHGLMQLQDNDLFVTLETCAGMKDFWDQESCHGGVFMENVMNAINPGHESRYLNDDEPLYPCTAVKDQYKQQCYLMQTSHALRVVNQDFGRVFELCATVADPFNVTCYQSLGRDASGGTSSDIEQTKARCNLGTSETARKNCFVGAVKDFISYFNDDDQGLALCASLTEVSVREHCTSTATNYYNSL
jgi:hypothetical protein